MQHEITVTIACITFNHGKYLRQALDGFLFQKISGNLEILIHDDASTDDTIEILQEYAGKYPDVFTLFLEKENQYGKGRSYFLELFRKARGQYIAICEGDDFWSDPDKLSKQIKILEEHPECIGCCHNEVVINEDGTPWPDFYQNIYRQKEDIILDASFLYDHNKFSHTASLLIRSELFLDMTQDMVRDYLETKANGDLKWAAMMAACGKVYLIAEDMACYRYVCSGGDSWSAKNAGKNISLSTYEQLERLQGFIRRNYNVDIDYGGNMSRLWQTAALTWLKKPNKANRKILKAIAKRQKKNDLHIFAMVTKRAWRKLLHKA